MTAQSERYNDSPEILQQRSVTPCKQTVVYSKIPYYYCLDAVGLGIAVTLLHIVTMKCSNGSAITVTLFHHVIKTIRFALRLVKHMTHRYFYRLPVLIFLKRCYINSFIPLQLNLVASIKCPWLTQFVTYASDSVIFFFLMIFL